MRFALLSLAVAATIAAAGCASSMDDAAADTSADLTASGPITLGNFINHPKIKEIRAEVAAVDAAKLTRAKKDAVACPDSDIEESWTKFTDEAGTIRKFGDSWGGSDGDGTTTYYYDAAGHLRFVFDVLESAPADDSLHVTDTRVYFDAAGARIFEVAQAGDGTTAHPPAMASRPYKLPTAPEEIDPELVSSPGTFFDSPPKCD
jgi:hypothetical protein